MLSTFNHNMYHPFFIAHHKFFYGRCVDHIFLQPEVYGVTVAIKRLGNIGWLCSFVFGTSTSVLIWDGERPSHKGHFYNLGGALSAVRAQCNHLGVWPYWRPIL